MFKLGRKDMMCSLDKTMVAFKAVQCWLRLKLSKRAPKNWAEKRRRIDDRITKLTKSSRREASIEEIPENEEEDSKNEENIPTVNSLQRMENESRGGDIEKVIKYNILEFLLWMLLFLNS